MTITDQKFYLHCWLKNGEGSLPVASTAQIGQLGSLLMSQLISVKSFQNLTRGFGEEDFVRISSSMYCAKSPHSPEPSLWTDQNFENNV